MNIPTATTIKSITQETHTVKTITFEYPASFQPGQFLMIWIPGVDEIPMSISSADQHTKAITFKNIGEATNALFKLKPGDKIGVRGPFGNGFTLETDHVLFVGGGTGIATLAPAVEQASQKKKKATVIIGAKTKDELFFEERLKKTGATVHITTDDGTQGYHGLATDKAKEILSSQTIDSILTCGPELMMKTLLTISTTTAFQASLERYMKCAAGICGQCCIGEGLRVCKDGPVFDGKTLKKIPDFGIYRRDSAGTKIRF